MLVLHADGGGEAAEEEAAGFEGAPCAVDHAVEVLVVEGLLQAVGVVLDFGVEAGFGLVDEVLAKMAPVAKQ